MSTAVASPAPAPADYIRERHFSLRSVRRWMRLRRELAGFLVDVLCELVAERATGKLTINLSQGSATCAEFDEQSPISDPS
jgi:hypothetical protein